MKIENLEQANRLNARIKEYKRIIEIFDRTKENDVSKPNTDLLVRFLTKMNNVGDSSTKEKLAISMISHTVDLLNEEITKLLSEIEKL